MQHGSRAQHRMPGEIQFLILGEDPSRADPPVRSTSVRNAVSNWRTSRVTSCITAAGRLAAFSTTTRPLPRNARRLKTSTCRYSRSSMTISLTSATVAPALAVPTACRPRRSRAILTPWLTTLHETGPFTTR